MESPYENYSHVLQDQVMPQSVYGEILAKLSKVGSEILTKVGLVKYREGQVRSKHFKENGHKWSEEDYEHEGFQVVYCERLFITRAAMIYSILSVFETRNWLPNLLYDTTTLKSRALHVASFGCGPGSDLVGFEAFYSSLKMSYVQALHTRMASLNKLRYSEELKCIQEAKIDSIIGYDSATGWGRYLEVLGHSFKHQIIDSQFVAQMEPVDVLILSYFAHNALFSKPLDPPQYLLAVDGYTIIDRLRNWDILMQKSKLIIVLDTKVCKHQLFSLLTRRGFGGIPEILDDKGREVTALFWCRNDLWT